MRCGRKPSGLGYKNSPVRARCFCAMAFNETSDCPQFPHGLRIALLRKRGWVSSLLAEMFNLALLRMCCGRGTARAPTLTITHSGNSVKVLWPYPSTGWTLQQNPDLTTANWSTSGGVSNDGTNNFITIPLPAGNLFFRLSHP